MNWQEIIKALITLPQNNKDFWVEILSSDENMTRFMNRVGNGRVSSSGLKRTLSFLRAEDSSQHLENFSSIEHDEEEIVRRYNEIKPRLISLLENKATRDMGEKIKYGTLQGEALVIENNKKVFDLLDALVEAKPSKVTVNSNMGKRLLSIEKYFINHNQQLKRMRNGLVAKYGEFFSTWPIPGIVAPSSMATGKKIIGADGKERDEYKVNPAYQEEWWDGNNRRLKTLISVFKDSAPPTVRYTANTLDAELTHTYYSDIAKHNKILIPDELQASDLFLQSKNLKLMNPNLLFLLKEDNPFIAIDKAGYDKLEAREDEDTAQQDREHWESKYGPDFVDEDGKPINPVDPNTRAYQERLESVSGKGMLFTEWGYEYLGDILTELKKELETAKRTDGNFSAIKQRRLKLLSEFLELPTNTTTKEYTNEDNKKVSEEFINVNASPTTIARMNRTFNVELEREHVQIPEGIKISLKTVGAPKTAEVALSGIDLNELTGEPEVELSLLNLLNTIVEADEALDLNSFTDNTFSEFEGSVTAIRETIIEITQEKVEDIVHNPTNYRKLKPIKSAEFEGATRTQTKKESTVFDALVNKKLISELS